MSLVKLSIFLLIAVSSFGQTSDKPVKFGGSFLTLRKNQENNMLLYSEKHDKIINGKEDKEAYPDPTYYVIKPVVNLFWGKEFTDDKEGQLFVRIDYTYQKEEGGKPVTKKILNWDKSYYPSIQKVIKQDDSNASKGKLIYHLKDSSQVWLERDSKGEITIFYFHNNSEFSFLSYALMLSDCKNLQ